MDLPLKCEVTNSKLFKWNFRATTSFKDCLESKSFFHFHRRLQESQQLMQGYELPVSELEKESVISALQAQHSPCWATLPTSLVSQRFHNLTISNIYTSTFVIESLLEFKKKSGISKENKILSICVKCVNGKKNTVFGLFVVLFCFDLSLSILCNLGCPGTLYIDQTDLELKDLSAFTFSIRGLKEWATTPA